MNKKICVVGAGYWGKNHIKTLKKMDSLGGIVDSCNLVRREASIQYPDISFFKSVKSSFSKNFDGYIIATPADTHFKVAMEIIEEGKPLLVEKPMTLSIEDAEKLIYAAESYDVNMMVGHVMLFHPAITRIKKVISDGTIGDLQYIYSNRLNLGKVRTEENVFWSLAPHDIAVFQYLTDSKPNKINSIGSSFLQKDIYDSTLTHLEYENGAKGHIFVSWLHPFKEHRLVVVGSEAMISFEDSKIDKPLKLYSKKIDLIDGVPEKIDGPVEILQYEKKMPLEVEIDYFLEHLNNKKMKKANMYHGLEVMRVLSNASSQLIT